MEGKEKRQRSQNWDINEKVCLISNLKKLIHIIENKKKLTSSNKVREEAWKKVQDMMKIEGYIRDIPRLKEQWLRLKTQAKKNIAEFKRSRRETGGGPASISEPWEYDYIIKEMIPYEFKEDISDYDSEALPTTIITAAKSDDTNEPSKLKEMFPNSNVFEIIEYEENENLELNLNDDTSPNTHSSEERSNGGSSKKLLHTPKRRLGNKSMSAYEESMFKLNEKKINLAMKHAEELHMLQKQKILLEIRHSEELHKKRMQNEDNKNNY